MTLLKVLPIAAKDQTLNQLPILESWQSHGADSKVNLIITFRSVINTLLLELNLTDVISKLEVTVEDD